MTVIKDIRLFRSTVPNVDGNPLPSYADDRQAALTARHIAMKLREGGFSLGDFDHLYVNFTPCLPEGAIRPAARSVCREVAWYRFYDVGIAPDAVDDLSGGRLTGFIINAVGRVLLECFSDAETVPLVRASVRAATTEGDGMLMRLKQKTTGARTAVVYLRLLDSGRYVPRVCVYDAEGHEFACGEMAETVDLFSVGEVRLGAHKVMVMPRKSVHADGIEAFELTF